MDGGPPGGVGLGLAQDLAGHRRDVALAEEHVAGQVQQRVALGPVEVGVRPTARRVAAGTAAGPRSRWGPPSPRARSTRWPPTSSPRTLRTSRELGGVADVTSRKRTGCSGGMSMSSRALPLLVARTRRRRGRPGGWR